MDAPAASRNPATFVGFSPPAVIECTDRDESALRCVFGFPGMHDANAKTGFGYCLKTVFVFVLPRVSMARSIEDVAQLVEQLTFNQLVPGSSPGILIVCASTKRACLRF